MNLKPDDLVLVHIKAPPGDHKITDQWEDMQYRVLSQLDNQPVFRVQPVDAVANENIKVLHRNVLFLVQTIRDLDSVITDSESEYNKQVALMKANLLMDIHFDN